MADDSIFKRFNRKRKERQLGDLAERGRSIDDIEAEKQLLEETEKVDPIKADAKPGRNDPCPCGSGKKHKKCCGASG